MKKFDHGSHLFFGLAVLDCLHAPIESMNPVSKKRFFPAELCIFELFIMFYSDRLPGIALLGTAPYLK